MKIVQVHNYYQQAGGEDGVVAAEKELLEATGHTIVEYYKDNKALDSGLWALVKASIQTLWNWETYAEFRKLLKSERPDLVHCHNTFPIISPSIYWVCAKENVPVVQTLHNYRLLCLNAFLFRQGWNGHEASGIRHQVNDLNPAPNAQRPTSGSAGAICELCVKKSFKYPGIKYGCYRDSKAGSFVVALMLLFHKLIGTWSKKVDAYIALTDFHKKKLIEGGLPGDKIFVKPNFIQRKEGRGQRTEDGNQQSANNGQQSDFSGLPSDIQSRTSGQSPFALFVGRLSPEKGCDVLIRAWAKYQNSESGGQQSDSNGKDQSSDFCPPTSDSHKPRLLIAGDGPDRGALEDLSENLDISSSVKFLGKQPKGQIMDLMKEARFLVLPSLWYEGFPMTIVEAFSQDLPVIASNLGGMASVIVHNETGLLFEQGNSDDLAEKVKVGFRDADAVDRMSDLARHQFNTKYTDQIQIQQLTGVYDALR